MDVESFSKLLQFSISPIALISGASLLLLSITNRFGRAIDRARLLAKDITSDDATPDNTERSHQICILLKRAGYLRAAILCISGSIVASALMIMGVAGQLFFGVMLKGIVMILLTLSVSFITAAVILLFLDVAAGLKALQLEVQAHLSKP